MRATRPPVGLGSWPAPARISPSSIRVCGRRGPPTLYHGRQGLMADTSTVPVVA